MLQQAPPILQKAPHVIVVGNEKGGSGKTTLAMHVAIALINDGQRVGTVDLDSNQKSLTHYIENRKIWAGHRGLELQIPIHRCIPRAEGARLEDNEAEELAAFESAIRGFEDSADFLVIDTPANDSYLMRLAHLLADTLLTPLNDSFLDFGTLGAIDPLTHEITETGHYAAMVCEARRRRRLFDRSHTDWRVVRNRFSLGRLVDDSLDKLAMRLGFRPLDGCAERIMYRQLFPSGLTACDPLDEATLGTRPGRFHRAAQQELRDLYALLQLPTNDRARRRASARAEWFASATLPLEADDLVAD
ncbi:MAG: division plane positioning ATPase MipZ [Xanthobacteraceae bacterium]|jgi:chromosome partitioning protein